MKPAEAACRRKRRFPDKRAAKAYRRNMKQLHGLLLRPYFCVHCQRWHLSTERR